MSSSRKKSQMGFTDVLRFAAGYWRRQPRRLGLVLGCLLVSALIETYLPNALADFLGAIRLEKSHDAITHALVMFLGLYFLQALVFVSTFRVYNVFETNLFKQVLDDAFAHVYRLPEPYFANTFMGAIISKINRARTKIETFEDQIILRIFPTFVVLTGTIIFLAMRFPMLALLMTVYLIILACASAYLVFNVSGPAQAAYAEAQDHFGAHLADSVSGISTAKAYAQEGGEYRTFVAVTEALRGKNASAYLRGNTAAFCQRMLLTGMLVLLLGGGTWYLFNGQATVESMAYLAFAYNILQSYIKDLGENIKNLLTSSYDLHAIIDILREPPEVPDEPKLPALDIKKGAITFENAGFTYPGKDRRIFDKFNISIKAGERVALVGHSGSGKTTFVRLLQHMYPLQEGRITIDGQDIAAGSRHSLRSAIALVPQDPILFHRSLSDNIAYGQPGASMAAVQEAAKQAHIHDFIMTLPQQYDTLVGERGVKLSGGERQRIAIARAILADRPILILDEATSSLDSESERAIQDALLALTHGRTSIMIAHRLSTILDADRIIVFDEGKIVEEGTHDELVNREHGIYAGFFRLQSGGFITD
jgi:ATP-binding cassette subfamily B protein